MKAYTLVEVTVTLLILAFLSLLLFSLFGQYHHFYVRQREVSEMSINAATTLDLLTRDFQTVGYEPEKHAFFPMVGERGLQEALRLDPDGNGALDEIQLASNDRVVQWRLDPQRNLFRNQSLLLEGVAVFDLQFFDDHGNLLTWEDLRPGSPDSRESLVTLVKVILETEGKIRDNPLKPGHRNQFMTMVRLLNR